jgi:DnaK suppressor protein
MNLTRFASSCPDEGLPCVLDALDRHGDGGPYRVDDRASLRLLATFHRWGHQALSPTESHGYVPGHGS